MTAAEPPVVGLRWPHFRPGELACRCGCQTAGMDPHFMTRLQAIREAYDAPLMVLAAYRCGAARADTPPLCDPCLHHSGRAIDLRLAGEDCLRVLWLALEWGMTGVGLYQHGTYGHRAVHLDDLPAAPGRPRPWVWTGL